MNAWLKRCVFNLDLNRESVSEPRTFSGRLFHSYITIIYHLIVNICVNFTLDRQYMSYITIPYGKICPKENIHW